MIALLLAHAVVGLAVVATGDRLGRRGLLLGALPPAATFAWVLARLDGVVDGDPVTERVRWVPELGLGLDLRLDGFAALFVLLVSGIGVLVFAYAGSYLGDDAPDVGRLAGLLTLFAGAMLAVVVADDLLALYGAWELTSITSYLLIGNAHRDPRARAAALQALLITGAGALAMLGGFVLIGRAAGTYRLSAILADPPSGSSVTVGLVLVLVGACSKSAQYPFHSWLPGAMVAPTPVSAYLHSATMVKAGVYLVGRLAPAFATVGPWRPIVVTVGLVTMVVAGLRALRQYDLKLLLAYGTVSQLGFMVVLFGVGTPEATTAGCALVLAHALFKAALFMGVGILDHQHHTRDLRELPPPGPGWGPTVVATVVALASMAGLPVAFGFVAKESALDALDAGGFGLAGVALAGVTLGSVLTVAYTARFAWGMLRARPASDCVDPGAPPAPSFVAPLLALSAVTLVVGVVPRLADDVVGSAATALDDDVHGVHLALWHGITPALGLSVVAVAGGVALFVLRRRVSPLLARGARVPSGSDAYAGVLRGLNHGADLVTAVSQSGSLPIYAGVILATASVSTGTALLADGGWPGLPRWVESVGHLPVSIAIVAFALAAALVRRRFSAALFLGATGYAMAGLFVVQGAPDLALTQVAIETLTTVLFVLVLRRLPNRFETAAPLFRRVIRLTVAGLVGAMVFVMAIAASASRTEAPVSVEMVARAQPDGHGRNVVNVILVDFRALDTMGEITVLAAAAIGAVAIARSGRRPRPDRGYAVDGDRDGVVAGAEAR